MVLGSLGCFTWARGSLPAPGVDVLPCTCCGVGTVPARYRCCSRLLNSEKKFGRPFKLQRVCQLCSQCHIPGKAARSLQVESERGGRWMLPHTHTSLPTLTAGLPIKQLFVVCGGLMCCTKSPSSPTSPGCCVDMTCGSLPPAFGERK